MNQKNYEEKFQTLKYVHYSNTTLEKARIQYLYEVYVCLSACLGLGLFFFLIKSQEQQSGMDFLNYQVSHLLLSKAKYHVIPYLIKPLKSLWFFHNYFALPNMKIHCRSQVSKTIDFIPKKSLDSHSHNCLLRYLCLAGLFKASCISTLSPVTGPDIASVLSGLKGSSQRPWALHLDPSTARA